MRIIVTASPEEQVAQQYRRAKELNDAAGMQAAICACAAAQGCSHSEAKSMLESILMPARPEGRPGDPDKDHGRTGNELEDGYLDGFNSEE